MKIKCNNIDYRKGYIEVTPGIHDRCVNIEVWEIHVDIDLAITDIDEDSFPGKAVIANTEIEMNIAEAEELVNALQLSINKMRNRRA